MLDAFLPEVLTRVARVEVELHSVLVVALGKVTHTTMTRETPQQRHLTIKYKMYRHVHPHVRL